MPVVGTSSAVNPDESYVVIQLDTLEQTGHWTLPHPFPEADPSGMAFPVHGATRHESGYVLYDKHPALIYLYQPIHRVLGVAGLVALSLVATWAAALVAARLAEGIIEGSGVAALWMVGLGSPLFFDAYQVHAHTIGAALAALLTLMTLRVIERRRAWMVPTLTAPTAGLVLMRTEGILFVAALGGAVGLLGLLGVIGRRLGPVLIGLSVLATGGATFLLERTWSARMDFGPQLAFRSFTAADSYLDGRVTSLSYTLLMPGYRGGTLPEIVTLLGATLLIVGTALAVRRHGDDAVLVLPMAGGGLLAVRSVLEWGPVPGLLVAFCVGMAGLTLLRGDVAHSPRTRLLLTTLGAYVLAVGATQYPGGGTTEWGGRYFALGIPLLGAVAAASLHQVLAGLPGRTRRAIRGSLVVAALAMAVLAVSSITHAHDRNRDRTDGVLAAAVRLPASVDGQKPVVLTEDPQIPRLSRGRLNDVRFLLIEPEEITPYLDRLARLGITDVLIVSIDPSASLPEIPASWSVADPVEPHALQYDDGGGLIRVHLTLRTNISS